MSDRLQIRFPSDQRRGSAEGWQPLPAWAGFAWELGARLGTQPPPEPDGPAAIYALSVPCRDLFAPLLAAAFVCGRSSTTQPENPENLAPEDAVWILEGSARGQHGHYAVVIEHGRLLGRGIRVSGFWVKRTLARGARKQAELREFIPYEQARRVVRAPSEAPNRAGRVRFQQTSRFASELLKGDLHAFHTNTRLDCLLIGPRALVLSELEAPLFRTARRAIEGRLMELVRARDGQDGKASWRTRIVSEHASSVPDHLRRPGLVVFDGTVAYRRWRREYSQTPAVVVLDRSRHGFRQGVELVTSDYERRAGALDSQGQAPAPPPGIEMTSFLS